MQTTEQHLELTPAERAVLRQIRDIFGQASITSYRLPMLISRWPATHREAYRIGFDSLVKKGLLLQRAGDQLFSVTSAGLRAMAYDARMG